MMMTTAATHRHGWRSGTASIAAGEVAGGVSTSVIVGSVNLVDRAVDHRLVDHPCLDTPVAGDLLVRTVFDQVLERLLERLRERRTLLHRPAVGRGVSDLARGFELAVALLDRIRGDR